MIATQQRQLISLEYVVWIVFVVFSRSSIAIPTSEAFLHPTPSSPSKWMVHRRSTTGSKRTTSLSHLSAVHSIIGTPTTITSMSDILRIRGGDNEDIAVDDLDQSVQNDITETLLSDEEVDASNALLEQESQQIISTTATTTTTTAATTAATLFPLTMIMNVLRRGSSQYTLYLQQYPIRTKSVTAMVIFAMSDFLAQLLTKSTTTSSDDNDDASNNTTIVWTRILSSAAVGFFYFGPAAHYWYSWIFRILPSTSLYSTLQKAILGQLFFGPSFTCIFFAMSLIQSRTFTLKHWIQKIRNDLPSAWIAGAGYWPIVDLISYSYIPPQYIPLFVNICSFFWTTYLVVKSYK